jgi:hypothetical protein
MTYDMVLDAEEIQQVRDIIREELVARRISFHKDHCQTEEL